MKRSIIVVVILAAVIGAGAYYMKRGGEADAAAAGNAGAPGGGRPRQGSGGFGGGGFGFGGGPRLPMTVELAAVKRGVRVRIITPGPITDAETVRRASRALWGELLEAGVEIVHPYQANNYRNALPGLRERGLDRLSRVIERKLQEYEGKPRTARSWVEPAAPA